MTAAPVLDCGGGPCSHRGVTGFARRSAGAVLVAALVLSFLPALCPCPAAPAANGDHGCCPPRPGLRAAQDCCAVEDAPTPSWPARIAESLRIPAPAAIAVPFLTAMRSSCLVEVPRAAVAIPPRTVLPLVLPLRI